MSYVAVYLERSLKPVVSGIACSRGTLVPVADDVTFTVSFDRDMDTAVMPVFVLLSGNASSIPVLPGGGAWLDARRFRSAPVVFGADNGGAYTLRISGGTDTLAHVMDVNESFGFTMDALAPPNPLLALESTTSNSATINWNGYAAPVDLSGFRYFLEQTDFTSRGRPGGQGRRQCRGSQHGV